MALSRVYLAAHWFSDVVTGVLLGTGIALGSAALVTEITNALGSRGVIAAPGPRPATPRPPADVSQPAVAAAGPPPRPRRRRGRFAPPVLLRLADQVGEGAERDLHAECQSAEHQHRADDRRLLVGGRRRGQTADVAEVDHADPAGRDRHRREEAAEREHGEDLRGADVLLGHAHAPEREQEHDASGDLAEDRRRGVSRSTDAPRGRSCRPGTVTARSPVSVLGGLRNSFRKNEITLPNAIPDAAREVLAREEGGEQPHGHGEHDHSDHRGDQVGRAALPRR